MLTVPTVLRAFGGTRNQLNKWIASGHMASQVPEGSPGVASRVPRKTALEIAFMVVLTDVGFEPVAAKAHAQNWVRLAQTKDGCPPVWFFNPASGHVDRPGPRARYTLDFARQPDNIDMIMGMEQRPAAALCVVHVGEIIARIDKLEQIVSEV